MNKDFSEYSRFSRFVIRLSSSLKHILLKISGKCENDKLGVVSKSASNYSRYICFVRRATSSDRLFKSFKRNFLYREVLEHIPYSLASIYYESIPQKLFHLSKSELLALCKINDLVGNPILYNFDDLKISGSTLRYVYIASLIVKNLKIKSNSKIVEIGVGYGGQALVLGNLLKIKKYYLIDLPSVSLFAEKYLNSHYLEFQFESSDLNNFSPESYDLCISNYAFSELPRNLQEIYIKKVILNSQSGFMIMNTGNDIDSPVKTEKYKASELLELIPNSKIIPEIPLTKEDNYIFIWGNFE